MDAIDKELRREKEKKNGARPLTAKNSSNDNKKKNISFKDKKKNNDDFEKNEINFYQTNIISGNVPTKNMKTNFDNQKNLILLQNKIIPLLNNFQKKNTFYDMGGVNATNEFNRMLPRNISQDKERLYEDALILKQQMNALKDENQKLKAKTFNSEKELFKLKKQIEELENFGIIKIPNFMTQESSHFVDSLKKKMKEMKEELENKNQEILNLKKNIKFTRLKELQIENQNYISEASRLKEILNSVLPEDFNLNTISEKKENEQNNEFSLISTLKKDNSDLAYLLKNLESQNINLKETIKNNESKFLKRIEILTKQNEIYEKENNNNKEKIKFLPNDDKLKNIDLEINELNEKYNELLNQNNKILEENQKLNNTIDYKEQNLIEIEKKLINLEKDYNDFQIKNNKKIELLQKEIKKEKEYSQKILLEKEKLAQEINKFQNNMNSNDEIKKINENIPIMKEKSSPKTINKNLNNFKKIPKIPIDKVTLLSEELHYKLRNRNISCSELNNIFIKSTSNLYLSINELMELFAKEPFNIKDKIERENISRFLIENDDNEDVIYNCETTCEIKVISSLFLNLIGKYNLISLEERNKLLKQVLSILEKKPFNFDSHHLNSKSEILSFLKSKKIILNQNEIDILMMYIYENINNHSELNSEVLNNCIQKLKQILQKKQSEDVNIIEKSSLNIANSLLTVQENSSINNYLTYNSNEMLIENNKINKLPPLIKTKAKSEPSNTINEKALIANKKIASYNIVEIIEEEKIGESMNMDKSNERISIREEIDFAEIEESDLL